MIINKGESTTIAINLENYDKNRIKSIRLFVGITEYGLVEDGEFYVCRLSSIDTATKGDGVFKIFIWLDDTVLGVRKPEIGSLEILKTGAIRNNDSVSDLYDVTYILSINETEIIVEDVLYNYIRGADAFQVWQSQAGNLGKTYEQYIAYLREPMTLAIEEGEQTAAEWAIVEAERVAEELIRKDDEEERRAAEVIREQVKDATIQATEAAIQTNTDIQAEEVIRATAETGRVSWYNSAVIWYNNAVISIYTALSNIATAIGLSNTATQNANTAADLANEKAGEVEDVIELSNTAISNANAKAILADDAATNANTVATNVANAEAARVASGAELKTNKTSDIEANKTSTDKYPNTKGVVDYVKANNQFKFISRDVYNQLTRPLIATDIYFTSQSQFISPLAKVDGFTFQNDKLLFPNYAAPENLVLHYDFSGMKNSDMTKAVARDLSGNGNNGTLSGFGYIAGSGYENNGLKFDSIDDFVTHSQGTPFITGELTLEVTFKATNVSKSQGLLSLRKNIGSPMNLGISLYCFSGTEIILESNGGTPRTNNILTIGNIYNVVATVNPVTNEAKLYVNGLLKTTTTLTLTNYQTITVFSVGKYMYDLSSTLSEHLIFNSKVYNKVLSQLEVTQNYEIDKKRFNII